MGLAAVDLSSSRCLHRRSEFHLSSCQFHRLFGGKVDQSSGERRWDPPFQHEFSNMHKSTKEKVLGVEHLHGFKDMADTALYSAAKLKFDMMVGKERCYKYMTVDEIKAQQHANNTGLPFLKIDDEGKICKPLSCAELGKQCGEWDDHCGRTIICGMCDAARTGLPSTWRVTCAEGMCVDYCPPWDNRGYWFPADDAPPGFAAAVRHLRRRPVDRRDPLSPLEAVLICEAACAGDGHDTARQEGLGAFVGTGLCRCGAVAKMLGANLTRRDFAAAHEPTASCRDARARKEAVLAEGDTQPVCCPHLGRTPPLPDGWSRGVLRQAGQRVNVEGEYFSHVRLGCGAFAECEQVALRAEAEMAVLDGSNSMCYLARNLQQLDDAYPVTKDNGNRFYVDLRKK